MGCGASTVALKYQADSLVKAQADLLETQTELKQILQKQSEQIAILEKQNGQSEQRIHVLSAQVALPPDKPPNGPQKDNVAVVAPVRICSNSLGDKQDPLLSYKADAEGGGGTTAAGALRLVPAIQNYDWGKPWDTSLVAQLCESEDRRLDRNIRYAEMWMGTHPNGPSAVLLESADSGRVTADLKQTIAANPEFWLGRDARLGNLPFLLKVLSVHKALSIQAHPNKQLAEYLHNTYPDKYKDANHKPEICLPLGAFEALCAFRPLEEVRRNVADVQELQRLCGDATSASLKDLFSRLMRTDPATVAEQVVALVQRIEKQQGRSPEEDLILRLHAEFPGDVGIFSVFFLNYVRITPDMSNCFIFCAPDEPHAYLFGDCVECMSLSDNVVRAGLTPKFKDVETLLGMMTWRDDRLSSLVNVGERISSRLVKYNPPVDDFLVYEVMGDGGDSDVTSDFPLELEHASICLSVRGTFSVEFFKDGSQMEEVTPGSVFFCRAGTLLTVLHSDPGSKLFIATY